MASSTPGRSAQTIAAISGIAALTSAPLSPSFGEIIDDASFFDGIPHTLITWETDGAGNIVFLSEGRELAMPDDEYVDAGFRFSPDTATLWQNPGLNAINLAQNIGGTPHNFLGVSLFGDDIATEFIIEFLRPVHAVGFWLQSSVFIEPPMFEAKDADGNSLGSAVFNGALVDGVFDGIVTYGFMGFSSATEIASLELVAGLEDGFFLDNFTFSSVPAPHTAPPVLCGVALASRRRR